MLLIRDTSIGNAVFGKLLIDGEKVCDTLENRETLIPLGELKHGSLVPLDLEDFCRI